MSAPAAVQEIIWAGNQLIGLPYIYGGGHASFISPGYDCSGTVSFALHGADLLPRPRTPRNSKVWGSHGVGRWVTIFSNAGHAYMTVAGLRLDTSSADDPSQPSRAPAGARCARPTRASSFATRSGSEAGGLSRAAWRRPRSRRLRLRLLADLRRCPEEQQ